MAMMAAIGEDGPKSVADAIRRLKAGSVPEGYALVPKMMTLDFEAMEIIRCMTNDGATEDEFSECVLWVGETVDDDGKVDAYGLNIACNECLEEGSVSVIPFAKPALTGMGEQASVPDAEYIKALEDAFDIIQADANTDQNYGSLCRIGSVLAKLKAAPAKADGWIKCSERMPDTYQVVACIGVAATASDCDQEYLTSGTLHENHGFYVFNEDGEPDTELREVTHWMPLPTMPEQDQTQ